MPVCFVLFTHEMLILINFFYDRYLNFNESIKDRKESLLVIKIRRGYLQQNTINSKKVIRK